MATQLKTFVKGKIGNLVMYKLGDTYVARSRPVKVYKTENMQNCSSNFGIASKTGKLIRQELAPLLPDARDTNMQRRFSGCINKWLGSEALSNLPSSTNIALLESFNFTEATSFYERFKPKLTVNILLDGRIEINIPALIPTLQIAAPAHTEKIELCLAAVSCELGKAYPAISMLTKKEFIYNSTLQNATTAIFNLGELNKKLLMIFASLIYFFKDGSKEKRSAFLPASVIKADYYCC